MKSMLSPILSLVVCSVLLFGSTKCTVSTDILPSPTAAATKNSTSTHSPNLTIHSASLVTPTTNASTVSLVTTVTVPMPNMTSVFTTVLPNNTTANHSTVVSTSHPINSSITLTSVIMTSSAGNGSIHNSTIHPTLLPTYSIQSSTVHNASSRIHPTMTPIPSPTTSVVPSPSVPPTTTTPPPPLPKGKYFVTKNGTKCLLLWLSLEFTVTYKNNSGSKSQTTVKMPSNGTADGICEEQMSSIRISWPHYAFEAYFLTQKAANGGWITTNITITAQTMNNTDFVNANATTIQQSVTNQEQLEWLSGHVGKSLNCSVKETLKTDNMVATIVDLRIQPFEVPKSGDFAKQTDSCSPTPVPPTSPSHKKKSQNTVAIAVGCSLAGLVLIVLIGYFVGKRVRSRPGTGYRKL